jgi:SAM-dependent methyltransferase
MTRAKFSITREEVLELIRYRLSDPQKDVELEATDYLEAFPSAKSTEMQATVFPDAPVEFYASSKDFFLDLLGMHLKLPHLLERSAMLVSLAIQTGASTFADWGGGSGRDCIVMARTGLQATHLDVQGEGTRLAAWRYEKRGLSVKVADALNPPAEFYDLISNFDCLEHVEDPVTVVAQILSRLKGGGFLVLAGDFYNFDLEKAGPHLPKNFVYGGILQMAMQKIGIKKLNGLATPWCETALAVPVVWQKPADVSSEFLEKALRQGMLDLLSRFARFYEGEIARLSKIP